MNIKNFLAILGILMIILATGCTSIPPAEQLAREMAGVTGKSQMFTDGYRHGCQSGLSAGGNRSFQYTKDLARANQNDYKLGWEDGFRVCQSRQIQRNAERHDHFGYPYFPHTGISIGVQL